MAMIGKSKIGSYTVQVISENNPREVGITDQPVEVGLPLSDNVDRRPIVVNISGKIVRDSRSQLSAVINGLENAMNKGTLLQYQGRRIYQNMVIESFSYDADKTVFNGFNFQMKLKQIRLAKPAYRGKASNGRVQTGNKKSNSAQLFHKVKKGDTYWALGIKYGVRWQQLQTWNRYPPRRIPIGVKLRVR